MKPISPTPYADVNEILDLLLVNVKEILQDQFVGMYLYGSLSSGDFNSESSDIDFLVVTQDLPSQEIITALEVMHNRIWASRLKRAGKLEGAYVPQGLIRRHDPNGMACPTINEGKFLIEKLGSDWIIQRHVVRESGVVIEGPAPKTLIDFVSPDDIRRAVMGTLSEWWFPMLNDPVWLRNGGRGDRAFAVITMCRVLHALEHGTIVSKPRAIEWARLKLGDPWRVLIDQAIAVSQYQAQDLSLNEVLAFILFIKEQTTRPKAITPHPDVNELLNILYTTAKEILQDQFVGMYLFGSLANGDFDQHSDIDVLVVTKDKIQDSVFSSLQAMHAQLARLDSRWNKQLEVSYIPQKALRRFDPEDKLHPHLDRGDNESLHWMSHESDWIIQRHIVRECGTVLAGPVTRSLIDPISVSDLQRAIVDVLPLWAGPILQDPLRIGNRGYQSFIVLSLCRMLYTLQCGTITSKRAAADWAQASLSQPWKPLIARAWLGRQDAGSEAEPEDVEGTLKFIRYTMEYCQQFEYPKNESQNVRCSEP